MTSFKYFELREKYNGQNITTLLRDQQILLRKNAEELALQLNDLTSLEEDWLLGIKFSAYDTEYNTFKKSLYQLKKRLNEIEVQTHRGDANYLVRTFLHGLIGLIEGTTGTVVKRRFDYEEDCDYGVLHSIAIPLFDLMPDKALAQLKIKKGALNKAIRNALETY